MNHRVNLNQNELPNEAQPLIRQCGRANSLTKVKNIQVRAHQSWKIMFAEAFLETHIPFYCLWTITWHLSTGRVDLSHNRQGWYWAHICSYFTELAWPEPVVLVFPHCREKARLACLLFDVQTRYKVTCYVLTRFTLKCTSRIQKCKHEASQACAHTQSRDCKPRLLLRWVCLIVRSRWCQLKQFSSKECIYLYFLSDNVWEFFAVNSCNEKKCPMCT